MPLLSQLFTRRRRYRDLSFVRSRSHYRTRRRADRAVDDAAALRPSRSARREFGNQGLIEQRSREVWQWPTLESFLADIRFALRR